MVTTASPNVAGIGGGLVEVRVPNAASQMTVTGVSGATTTTYIYDNNDKLTQMGTTLGGSDLATFGYDSNGNMTSVAGSLFGSNTLAYNDENRLTSVTYPSGGGSQTDSYEYNALGRRMRHYFSGGYRRYVYDADRVLEVTNDAGDDVRTRYTTEAGSYYAPLVHMWFPTDTSRFPLYDGVGTARRLVDGTGTATDAYSLDVFGRCWGADQHCAGGKTTDRMDRWSNQAP